MLYILVLLVSVLFALAINRNLCSRLTEQERHLEIQEIESNVMKYLVYQLMYDTYKKEEYYKSALLAQSRHDIQVDDFNKKYKVNLTTLAGKR